MPVKDEPYGLLGDVFEQVLGYEDGLKIRAFQYYLLLVDACLCDFYYHNFLLS